MADVPQPPPPSAVLWWGEGPGGSTAAAVPLIIRPAGYGSGALIARACLAWLRGCPSALETQGGRKDGQLAVTQSRLVSVSQNPEGPCGGSGSGAPKVHVYWYNKGYAKGPEPIACGNVIP